MNTKTESAHADIDAIFDVIETLPDPAYTDLANRLAKQFAGTYSPRWFAILGAVLRHDYGVRSHALRVVSVSITSDGFVIGSTLDTDGTPARDAPLGSADKLYANLDRFLADITDEHDKLVIRGQFTSRITDWRR